MIASVLPAAAVASRCRAGDAREKASISVHRVSNDDAPLISGANQRPDDFRLASFPLLFAPIEMHTRIEYSGIRNRL